MIQTYLNKEQQAQFSALAKRLGIKEYQLLKLIVLHFLNDPFVFVEIQAKIRDKRLADKKT